MGPAQDTELEPDDDAGPRFLADLTGRRAWAGAIVLLVGYLLPVAGAWVVVRAYHAGLLGTSVWLGPVVVLVVVMGLLIALTLRFGGWFQQLDFGEEYTVTFRPVAGYFLGWWRLAMQLGSLVLCALIGASVNGTSRQEDVSNDQTRALPAHVERMPIPDGAEPMSSDSSFNQYADWPNATRSLKLVVPATFTVTDVEAWLGSPDWAGGVDGREPFGALQGIECDDSGTTCSAEVAPRNGSDVEYTVDVRLTDGFSVRREGTMVPAATLTIDVEYELPKAQRD